MALAGKFICSTAGIDCTGGFHPSLEAVIDGLGYAAPPIMALLFILDPMFSQDEVVKYSPHARAIRDVEDEELRSFFYGMSPWQGALADMFLRGTELMKDARGIASLVHPTYVVAPVLNSGSGREDLKKLFAAWFERRQMKKIYSPLLEGLLALYLGFEWIRVEKLPHFGFFIFLLKHL
ncbi:hypothetical protein BHE74_00037507 [Ensete ventricosum]|nr:hypothetical protein GW17_00044765 [Ensete ventricosum]RWW55817.1 hypothetical protein BHE74_00037507 [Ensete ventricosum]RZS13867.1 hypothetical protein BHM03_00045497 [Ensete ventricosum]